MLKYERDMEPEVVQVWAIVIISLSCVRVREEYGGVSDVTGIVNHPIVIGLVTRSCRAAL